MKKHFLYSIVLLFLFSCQEDVRFNNPSFQGLKDSVFWRAIQSKATIDGNGSLIVEGYTGNEIITLKTSSTALQTYPLGTSTSKTASYVLTNTDGKVVFSTGYGVGDGQITITEYDIVNNTVSGTFKFNLENIYNNPLAGAQLNFQQGVFYKVPVVAPVSTN